MGLDIRFQSFPEKSELFQQSLADQQDMIALLSFDLHGKDGYVEHLRKISTTRAIITEQMIHRAELAHKTAKQYPGLIDCNLWLGRIWDILVYLLIERRRSVFLSSHTQRQAFQNLPYPDNLIYRSMMGGDLLDCMKTERMRFVNYQEVHTIADVLSTVDLDQIEMNYAVDKMEAVGLYKFHASNPREEGIKEAQQSFIKLRNFYQIASDYNECVLQEII